MLANLCLLLVSCLVGVSLCEVSLRFFSPQYRHLAEADFSQDERRIWSPQANSRDSIGHPDNDLTHAWHHNNLALRQHRNFSEADLTAATNIGVFGDSFVENIGMDAPYSSTEPLDYLLNQGRTRFNVLNFGVQGYGPDQSFLRYEDFRYVNKLDYVLYVYCQNDIQNIVETRLFRLDETGHLARNEIIRPWWVPFIRRLHLSYLILDATGSLSYQFEIVREKIHTNPGHLFRLRRRQSQFDEYGKNEALAIFQQLIRRWKSSVETHGSIFYVVTLPGLLVDPFILSVFREEGVEVVNLHDCFGDHDPAHLRLPWDESPYRFRRDVHWNEAGNHLAAVCLYRFLEEKTGRPPLSEEGLRAALHRYYSAFGDWSPTDLGGGDVSPQALAHIRAKYQAFDETNPFEALWEAMRATPDKRIIEAAFDVYLDGTRLVYLKERCGSPTSGGLFFLHLTPVNGQDILPLRMRKGLRVKFSFLDGHGVKLDGDRCILVRYLPPWPLRSVRTGQYVPGKGRLWAREYSLDQKKSGEAVMEAMPSEKRIIRSTYDVYLEGKTLVYVKERCRPADREATFFLQVTPVDARVLVPDLRPQGFDTVYFNRCTREIELPLYAIRHIRTGQFVWNEGRLWEEAFLMEPAHVNQGATKRRLAGKRIIQSDYDVYLRDGRLIYRKERCGATDTSTRFFLHVTPVDKNHLDLDRAHYGFANLDFRWKSGFRFNEFGCRISHRLPAYAVRHIRTGQYLPGEDGRLWEGEYSFD